MADFYLPTELVMGRGALSELGTRAARYGERAFLVCGARSARASGLLGRVVGLLTDAGLSVTVYDRVGGEADLATVEDGLGELGPTGATAVVGLGGGSAIDTAKAIAGLAGLPGTVWEYHEGRPIERGGLPFVAVPTTAGTGAEVTKNAVLIDPRTRIKYSIRDDRWFARVAIVDPEASAGMPPEVTAASGADALCQAIESYTSIAANPVTDALAEAAIALVGRGLERAYRAGDDLDAREDMAYGSLMAGMAMASARLGGVHGMAHPLGSHFDIPHGVVCGLLLPYTMDYNLEYAVDKYARVGRLMGDEGAHATREDAARAAVERVRALFQRIGVPERLSTFGVTEGDFDRIIEESLPSGSLKHNPRPLGWEDVRHILQAAL